MTVTAIVGLQYGSEGKGHLAHLLASTTDAAIRTGGPNAGHTLTHRGTTYKMRQIPCAFVNPVTLLFIGPGGLIDPPRSARKPPPSATPVTTSPAGCSSTPPPASSNPATPTPR